MSDAERLSIVSISAPYHFFLCHQIRHILQKFSMSDERLEAASVLFTRSVDTDENLEVMLSPLHERERRIFHRNVAHYSSYVFSNPTGNISNFKAFSKRMLRKGHYELNLTIPLHRLIASRLKDCAYSESEGPVWKNIIYDEYSKQLRLSANYGPPEKWKTMIPTIGTLSLDYVTHEPIPVEAQPMTHEALMHFLEFKVGKKEIHLYSRYCFQVNIQFAADGQPVCSTNCSVADTQIMQLRREITNRFLTCAQLLIILSCFKVRSKQNIPWLRLLCP